MNNNLKQDLQDIVCGDCKRPFYPDYVKDEKGFCALVCDHCEVPKLINALLEAADKAKKQWETFSDAEVNQG